MLRGRDTSDREGVEPEACRLKLGLLIAIFCLAGLSLQVHLCSAHTLCNSATCRFTVGNECVRPAVAAGVAALFLFQGVGI